MLTTEQKLEYLINLEWIWAIGTLLDIPILILLYWLGYYNAFFVVIILIILCTLNYGKEVSELKADLDLE